MIILKILFNFLFLILVYKDIKYNILPEKILIIMFLIIIIKLFILKNFFDFYYSISIYSLPFHIIILLETYIKKELIGLGDIKLMLLIGAYFSNTNLYLLNIFYLIMYLVAFIYIFLFNPKGKYIAFVPMMYISFIIIEVFYI